MGGGVLEHPLPLCLQEQGFGAAGTEGGLL